MVARQALALPYLGFAGTLLLSSALFVFAGHSAHMGVHVSGANIARAVQAGLHVIH